MKTKKTRRERGFVEAGVPARKPGALAVNAIAKTLVAPSCRVPNTRAKLYGPQIVQVILANVLRGMRPCTAAQLAGTRPQTLIDWKKRFPDFEAALDQAEALCEGRVLELLWEHMQIDGHLALKFLERRFPEHWAPRWKHELQHSGSVEGVIPLEVVPAIQAARARMDGIDL